jgi:hypothetical protein
MANAAEAVRRQRSAGCLLPLLCDGGQSLGVGYVLLEVAA